MEKSTKILLIIIAGLSALITAVIASPGAREAIINGANNSMIQPLMGAWLGFCDWVDGFRGIYLLGSGIVGGLIFAVFINQIALPKIRKKTKKEEKPYLGAPSYVPPSVLPTTTAVVAPIAAVTAPVAKSKSTVEEESE